MKLTRYLILLATCAIAQVGAAQNLIYTVVSPGNATAGSLLQTNTTTTTQTMLTATGFIPSDVQYLPGTYVSVANASTGTKLYWVENANSSTGSNAGNAKIRRSELDGSNVTDVVTGLTGAWGMAIDPYGEYLYWTENTSTNNYVKRVKLTNASGSPLTLPIATTPTTLYSATVVAMRDIDIDYFNSKIYWLEAQVKGSGSPTNTVGRRIMRSALDGSSVEQVMTYEDVATPNTVTAPNSFEMNLRTGILYAVRSSATNSTTYEIRAFPLAASTTTTFGNGQLIASVPQLSSQTQFARNPTLDYLNNLLYYSTSNPFAVYSVPLNRSTGYSTTFTGTSVFTFSGVSGAVNNITTNAINPLPVELTDFRASCGTEAGTAELSWGTASEKNNAGFEVQRSLDGKRFERLGFVAGAGTSSTPQRYSYRDAGTSNGRRYYRLRQLDYDGSESFSPVQSVSSLSSPATQSLAYPNPAHDKLNLPADVSEARLLDATGRLVLRYQRQADGNSVLKLGALPAGLYRLELRRADGQLQRQPVAVE